MDAGDFRFLLQEIEGLVPGFGAIIQRLLDKLLVILPNAINTHEIGHFFSYKVCALENQEIERERE